MAKNSQGIISDFLKIFDRGLTLIEPPFMKLTLVFVVGLIAAIVLLRDRVDQTLCLVLFVVVILVMAFLAGGLHYLEMRLKYVSREKEKLKSIVRNIVMEKQEIEKKGS